MVAPPRDEEELLARARALRGCSIESLAGRWGVEIGPPGVATKGKAGELIERALGATGGSKATWDFPALRVECKTIPVDERGVPRESTFVCTVSLLGADEAEWESSWVRAKLARTLWVPIEVREDGSRTIAEPRLWSPTKEQEGILAGDIEGVSARVGRWLQLRPKAAHGRVRTRAPGADGRFVSTVPRGFYLRARFTGAILVDEGAVPE
jgi:DNA mismatch repair protein MutH